MKRPVRLATLVILTAGLFLMPALALACATCGSSDWGDLGFSTAFGLKIDWRYDYINQDQLRSGRHAISAPAASQITHNGNSQEIEAFTNNDYLTLGLTYNISPKWGVNAQLPYIIRTHSTLGTASNGYVPGMGGMQYDSKTSALGDAKVMGRFQGFIRPVRNFGIIFGVKLPTGSYQKTGISTDPMAPGPMMIDRGLQPGTGTTDAIAGAYYSDDLGSSWNYFAQGMYQAALNSRDLYRPGDAASLNLGMSYTGFTGFKPQVQIDGRQSQHDTGLNADIFSTGSTQINFSPGLVLTAFKLVQVYGFMQFPIYQRYSGVQIAPKYTASLGFRLTP